MLSENMYHDGIGFLSHRGKKSIYYGVTTELVGASSSKERFVVSMGYTNVTNGYRETCRLSIKESETSASMTQQEAGAIASHIRKTMDANGSFPINLSFSIESPSFPGVVLCVNIPARTVIRKPSVSSSDVAQASVKSKTQLAVEHRNEILEDQVQNILASFVDEPNEEETLLITEAVFAIGKGRISKQVAFALKGIFDLV